MKKHSKPTLFRGRLFFVLVIFIYWIPASAGELGGASSIDLRPIQAVVFDMDGVTTPNSGMLWTNLGQEFLRSVAPGWTEGDLLSIKWKSLPDVHRWITMNRGATLSYEEYVQRREALAARIYGELAKLEPTFLEIRETLRAGNVPVALASANTRFSVDHMIRRFDLEDAFDAAVSSDELTPDQRLLGKSQTHLLACRRLRIPPKRALAVEDTPAGIEAARKAGMIAVGFRNGFNEHDDLSAARFVVRRLRDVLELF